MNLDKIVLVENPQDINWKALHALVVDSFAYMDARIDPPSSIHRMDAQSFQEKASKETLVIVNFEDKTIACMFCKPTKNKWLYVGKVAVVVEMRGKGIARKLIDHAFQMARKNNLHGLELETRIELTENHRTFEKLGFVKAAEYCHDGFDRPTTILMRAALN